MTWDTVDATDTIESKFKPSLVKRAKKRSGHEDMPGHWTVYGEEAFNDSYHEYIVTRDVDDRDPYHCSCQEHRGGQYRGLCSHVLFVILARKGKVQFTGPLDSDPESQHHEPAVTGISLSIPAYVEGAGTSLSESRHALAEEYNLWNNPDLPAWVHYLRKEQWVAVEEILAGYAEGKKVMFLDAPTGAGKTLIGELVRRKVSPKRAVYTCSTKTLQDQFLEDFNYASVIKGRANYPTWDHPESFPILSADACNPQKVTGPACPTCKEGSFHGGEPVNHCDHCHPMSLCPYRVAKMEMLAANLAVANVSYLLAAANYQEFLTGEPLIIVDEADTLEQELMRFVEFQMAPGTLKRYRLSPPDRKTVRGSWVKWIRDQAYPALMARLMKVMHQNDPRSVRETRTIRGRLAKLSVLGGWDYKKKGWGDTDGMDGWVYTGYDRGSVNFKPIRVDGDAQSLLWKHGKKWLLMSATIISAQQMALDLGLEDDEWGLVTVESNFPVENRPIYVQPVANMTYKEKDKAWPVMAKTIARIAEHHGDERILVHTVSYALADYLAKGVDKTRAYQYRNAGEREEALAAWLQSERGIMYAPSFDRGIDLPGDQCRVVIVAKVPYPNLKDKQISSRLHARGGQGWYSMLTVRSLIQMTGRAMRSKDDSSEIYLLDGQFMSNVWRKSRRMLPGWWSEALNMGGMPRDRR